MNSGRDIIDEEAFMKSLDDDFAETRTNIDFFFEVVEEMDDPALNATIVDIFASAENTRNWMDLEGLKKAAKLNSVTDLIINKMDVMREVGEWKVYENNSVKDLETEMDFTQYLASHMMQIVQHITFSDNPHRI